MLDIVFYVCINYRTSVCIDAKMMNLLKLGNGALVIPVFEYVSPSDGREVNIFPGTKKWTCSTGYGKGHVVTNYRKRYTPLKGYKEGAPWCHERFIGYGVNKAACFMRCISLHLFNKEMYEDCHEEICLRYSRNFDDDGVWDRPL
ncbi:glycosyltransferase family 49 protein [Backusella circina FSU 941]|nr:glycosyltransferase family 49 protein [Backusella circina FSU 941]